MRLITAQEIIQIHDDILERLAGVKGMPDPGRAEAIISRVHHHILYEGIIDRILSDNSLFQIEKWPHL